MLESKSEFIQLLRKTSRQGIEMVIEELERLKFFEAPASVRFHLNYPGGLMLHSMNVCRVALHLRRSLSELNPTIAGRVSEENIIIAALLHDVCKADIYRPTVKKVKNALGQWIDQPTYDVDYSYMPLGHGEKSVIMLLRWGLKLTDDEILAIRWHMGAWDLPFTSGDHKNSHSAASAKSPLVTLIQSADSICAHIIENK